MDTNKLFKFLQQNPVKGNEIVVKRGIQQLASDKWKEGYDERCKQIRKQRILQRLRTESQVKRLLDYLSDLTHSGNKPRKK